MSQKRIIVSVTNDLVTDQRVHKVCESLISFGYQVTLVGRKLPESTTLNRTYRCVRFRLWFRKGLLFYANYNLRLFFYLLFVKADIFLSNDLDTLMANALAASWRKKPLVYDSHEYFTEVPELINRPKVQRIWERIEKRFLPKVAAAYTVSQPIAAAYEEKYGIKMKLVRNFPMLKEQTEKVVKEEIILYQGAVNIGRGLEQAIEAMQWVEGAKLYIIGGGDIEQELHALTERLQVGEKVYFSGRLPFAELQAYTKRAKIGLSLEMPQGLNYTYAMPNKLFDYLHQSVPVLVSPLPLMKEIVEKFEVGQCIDSHQAQHIADKMNQMLNHKDYALWEANCVKAAAAMNWQKEEQVLKAIFSSLE